MNEKTIEHATWIDAPRERVWDALYEPEQLAQWFLPPVLGAGMKRDDVGVAYVLMGPMAVPALTFEAVEAPRRVTLRGIPDRAIAAAVALDEEGDGTRVAVTISGFGALPDGARAARLGPSRAAWEKALENLGAFVGEAELPYPQGYVAALLGYRLESGAKYAIERSIWIDAPRERVWQAITDPTQIQAWFSPGTAWRLSALEVGGELAAIDPETGADIAPHIIDVLAPPRQLVLRAAPGSSPVLTVTTYTLLEENGGTRLVLTDTGYERMPAEERHQNMEQNAFGYGMMLENLAAVAEGRDVPYPFGF
jgi:uncharacterized protein YndB with AHSA1/START domain